MSHDSKNENISSSHESKSLTLEGLLILLNEAGAIQPPLDDSQLKQILEVFGAIDDDRKVNLQAIGSILLESLSNSDDAWRRHYEMQG